MAYTFLRPETTYIRLSDVIFEWCKPLPPWHVNALKSLVNPEALLNPRHPLQARGVGEGGEGGKGEEGEEGVEGEEGGEGERKGNGAGLAVFAGVASGGKTRLYMSLRQIEYLRYYIGALGLIQLTEAEVDKWKDKCREEGIVGGWGRDEGLEGLRRMPLPDSAWLVRGEDLVDVIPVTIGTADAFKRAMKNARALYETTRAAARETPPPATPTTPPPAPVPPHLPGPAFARAQASHPRSASPGTNPGAWLSIDLQAWENEYGVVLDVGWAARWFVPSERHRGWVEKKDGEHWIVQEHEQKRNTDVGQRVPYLHGGTSQTLPLRTIKEKVRALVPLMRERSTDGPVHLIVHSADRHISSTTLLGLNVAPLEKQPGYATVPVADKDAEPETVVLFDTSVLLAAITNANALTAYPPLMPVHKSTWSLKRLADVLGRGGFVSTQAQHMVDGNSGNYAALKLECFTAMVVAGIETLQPLFAEPASVPALPNPTDGRLDLGTLPDLQHQSLTAAAGNTSRSVDAPEERPGLFTNDVVDPHIKEWDPILPGDDWNARAHQHPNAYDDEELGMDEYTLQQLIEELGDMEPQVGRFGPDWDGEDSDSDDS